MLEQMRSNAGIFRRHHVHLFQYLQCTQADILQISNRGGNYI